MSSWWAGKVRQFRRHLFGRVQPAERAALTAWLTPAQLALFDSMHRADQRHGLDVVAALRHAGLVEPDLLVAGLLHDCGKGRHAGVWHRVGWSLADRYGTRVRRLVLLLPGFTRAFDALDHHAARSAELLLAAGASARAAALAGGQDDPTDEPLGAALRLADEAN
jgi:hypothetical protein